MGKINLFIDRFANVAKRNKLQTNPLNTTELNMSEIKMSTPLERDVVQISGDRKMTDKDIHKWMHEFLIFKSISKK